MADEDDIFQVLNLYKINHVHMWGFKIDFSAKGMRMLAQTGQSWSVNFMPAISAGVSTFSSTILRASCREQE